MDNSLGGLENWTIFMDVICVSSLKSILMKSNLSVEKVIKCGSF